MPRRSLIVRGSWLIAAAVLALTACGCRAESRQAQLEDSASADAVAVRYISSLVGGDSVAASAYLWPGFTHNASVDPTERSSSESVTASAPAPVPSDLSERIIGSLTLVERGRLNGTPGDVVAVSVDLHLKGGGAPGLGARRVILARNSASDPWRVIAVAPGAMPLSVAFPPQ